MIRIYQNRYHRTLPPFKNKWQLIHLFIEQEEEWKKNKNRFPIRPRVFAFIHFFHSNNIPIEGNDWKGKLQFLFARGIREFERILGPQESKVLNLGFDPRKAAVEILKDCGMSEDEIFVKKRHYFIVPPRSTRLKYTPPGGKASSRSH